jgi:hypothetical protein
MPQAIDWTFIGKLEGAGIARGYVPNPSTSNSGVTVATGFDIGQHSTADLEAMGLPDELVAKLEPYAGLRGRAAADFLASQPLLLEADEVAAIDASVQATFSDRLASGYNAAVSGDPDRADFEDLPAAAQTVIASVAYQYGLNLKHRTPRFWSTVVAQDWQAAVAELRNFGDTYGSRRRQEAALLASII